MREPRRLSSRVWLFVALIALSSCSSTDVRVTGSSQVVTGSGVLTQEDRVVGTFSAVVLAGIGNLHLEQGPLSAVKIEGEDNLMQHLVVELQSGALIIRTASGIDLRPTLPIEYTVRVPSLDSIVLSGVGEIDIDGLTATQLSITGSGVGSIDVQNLNAQGLAVTLSGVVEITVGGQTTDQTVLLSGVGGYHGRDLASTNATVTASGVGDATVSVSTTLIATVTGQGSVYYVGNPAVTATVTGTGKVEQIP